MRQPDNLLSACGAGILYALINNFIYRMNDNWLVGVAVFLIIYMMLRFAWVLYRKLTADKDNG
ncbi:hypothetical protein [Fructobacillus fructosus]|uniref:hypothetical protein n=1 Tax=Fructobacillus fructosus TaxID=1631 RepID=UPI001658AD61|nr:hypothetical protein [Fructobacillus fructosus]MBD9366342.1 hypothetical protein [Leuconostoc mesenteroides]MBC9119145.1 hypothetical protein [Fructobacillus fructosus]CAK1248198.1 unnamed protein product [Fructobacillus fructosus]CAK1250992.1 unnamed protein product [Fructobacillus fructosus]CAK1251007.1 unnamed protein product [Fructobacillus fructosus]